MLEFAAASLYAYTTAVGHSTEGVKSTFGGTEPLRLSGESASGPASAAALQKTSEAPTARAMFLIFFSMAISLWYQALRG